MEAQALFDTLADPTRRRILALLLARDELCVCELTGALEEIQPKVSRHLGVMKGAGLVTARREGTWMHYRMARLPSWTMALLGPLATGAVPEFKADMKRLKTVAGRAARCAD
ncbi:MAG: metalloregulator ArsR/SmtB family transcription factor [Rhodocyclales bacterium]|nr:metalloregulator ArsR/SmtB family transcription factor [Rhodocyclales bacterium]